MKNIIYGIVCLLTISSFSKAQQNEWWEMMQDPSVNFYDIQSEFNNYWNGKTIEKGKGWKQFKRWENFVEPRVYPSGDRTVLSQFASAAIQYRNNQLASRNAAGNWSYIGNTTVPSGGGGAGRINCIAFHPTDPDIILVGTPAGGLWRSTNGGISWISNTDDLPSMGISAIAYDPLDATIVYMGTGDSDGSDTYSTGIFKSTDGGITWNATGFSYLINQSMNISKILIHPVNSNILIISTNQGIFRSSDSGGTWTSIATGAYKDLEFKPDDPSVVYASRAGRFFRSTDTGQSFTQITSGLPNSSSTGRHAIAVTPANPDIVYLLASTTGNGFYGFYKSTDAGQTFVQMSDSPNLLGWSSTGSDTGGQAWYDLALAADRNNANIVYVGGVNIWRSSNGGTTWSLSAHWYGGGAPYVHADIHALEMSHHNNQLFVGCDGGIFRRKTTINDYDDLSSNLQIGQIYRLGASASNPDLVITGWQDNGSNLGTANWDKVMGGDGMECIIHPTNPQIMYASIYYGEIRKSTDGGDDFNSFIESNGTGVDEEGEWVTPYILDPSNPNIMYVGKTQIYKSTNGGVSFSQISSLPTSSSGMDALAVAPSDDNYIYAARNSDIYVATNGTNFTDRSSGLPNASISGIAVSPNDPEKVWITFSGFNPLTKVYYSSNAGLSWTNISTGLPGMPANCIVYQNNSPDAIYIGTDIGVFYRDSVINQWVYFSDGLPNTIVNELEIHYGTGMIRAATYGRGLWESSLYSNIQNDISISSAADPVNESCGSSAQPKIYLFNAGDNTIMSATIGYKMDAGSAASMNWTGNLYAGDSVLISLPAFQLADGAHTFRAWSSLPNGNTDSSPVNDTLTINFNHTSANIPVVLEFTPDCFGEETSWNISSGTTVLYNGAFTGNYITPNQNEQMISEYFCLTSGCFTFNLADDSGNGVSGTQDGCEFNGDYLVYDIAGNILAENQYSDGDFGASETYNFCLTNNYYASFSSSSNPLCENGYVQFSDMSTNGTTSWNWSFPGGVPSTSTIQNPIVFYSTAGSYDVVLVTGNGSVTDTLFLSAHVQVNSTPDITLQATDILCNGNNDGKIVPLITGGTLPRQNFWSNNSYADSLISLSNGNYSLIVHDANGCRDTASAMINEPAAINVGLSFTDATCGATDGTISGTAAGGTGTLSVMWSDSVNTLNRTGLDIGTYMVTITDDNGCIYSETVVISNPNAPVISSVSTGESCDGECDATINSSVTGGTGAYTLNWTGSLPPDSVHTNICPGTYMLTVTDASGCSDRDTVVIDAGPAYPLAAFIPSDTVVTTGQTISFVNISSGSGNWFWWDFGDGTSSPFSSTSHAYGSEGTYTVTYIISNSGCSDTAIFVVTVDNSIGIAENDASDLKVYPNPASEEVVIDLGRITPSGTLYVFDMSGRIAGTFELKNKKEIIPVNKFAKGIYEFRFRLDDSWVSRKVVIN